jgi:hypothetical protein
VTSLVKKTDNGTHNITNQCKSGATDSAGTSTTPGVAYAYLADIYSTDPNTSAAWSASGVNAAKIGLKVAT